MKECVHDMEQDNYYSHREMNRAIVIHLQHGDLQENLDKL